MGISKSLTGIIMTIWTFFSMVILPLATLSAFAKGVNIQGQVVVVKIVGLNVEMIFILGLFAMFLTAMSYSVSEKNSAIITFLKYVIAAYYEWTWAEGVKDMDLNVGGQYVHVGVYLGVWIIMVIAASLLTGFLKALHKYLKAKKEEEEEEEEE